MAFLWVIKMNIPKGFVLVPVEPTRIQLVAGLGTNGIHPIYCAMVAAAPPVELPDYDEAKERELFERTRNAHTIRRNAVGDYVLPSSQDAWSGWSECAKSRARSAE